MFPFRVLGFECWALGFGFWVSGFGFWVSVLGFGVWVYGFRVDGLRFLVQPSGCKVWGLRLFLGFSFRVLA